MVPQVLHQLGLGFEDLLRVTKRTEEDTSSGVDRGAARIGVLPTGFNLSQFINFLSDSKL